MRGKRILEKKILSNGVRVIYEYRPGNITSFCIGFEAGANMEAGYNLGTAHALEHMLFKGTETLNELEINKLCDEIFGFNNAMTNYPYCIYYGSTLSQDFKRGFELYSDIILKPLFPEEGFREEMNIISEELNEWKDDLMQYCEDELLYNSFQFRRLKHLIIGTEESIKAISLEELKNFYREFYTPDNCVISIVSSLSIEETLKVIEGRFNFWNTPQREIKKLKLYEESKSGIYQKIRHGIKGAKIQYLFPIHNLTEHEIKTLTLFNSIFGEGTSSLLFDLIRTRNGLAYDVGSVIKNEKGIKLFNIYLSTSEKNIDTALSLIDELLHKIKNNNDYFTKDLIEKSARMLLLKRELKLEKSIELCRSLNLYELMYGAAESFYEELKDLSSTTPEEIQRLLRKVINNPSIQVIKS